MPDDTKNIKLIQKMGMWIADNALRIPRLDPSTHAIENIEYEHHEIHGGSSFTCHYENMCTNTNERTIIAFHAPDTDTQIHLIAQLAVTSIGRGTINENPGIPTGNGIALDIFNRDRNSSKVSELDNVMSLDEDQATPIGGTELDSIMIGAPSNVPSRSGIGGLARGSQEWILRRNTQYAFMIESLDASDNYHTIELNWYEHVPKD